MIIVNQSGIYPGYILYKIYNIASETFYLIKRLPLDFCDGISTNVSNERRFFIRNRCNVF